MSRAGDVERRALLRLGAEIVRAKPHIRDKSDLDWIARYSPAEFPLLRRDEISELIPTPKSGGDVYAGPRASLREKTL